MPPYSLKWMAEAGYVMGLSTIGEVARHMRCHYDAYFLIAELEEQMMIFDDMVACHENDDINIFLTDDEKREIDEEMEKAMAEGPSEGGQRSDELREATPDEENEEEGEQENKHF
jgi:hypothetical protein